MSSSKPTYPSTNPGTPSPAATPLPRNFAPLSRSDSLTNLTETGTQLSSTYEGEENGNSDGAKGRAEGSTFDGRGSVLSGLETDKQWMGSNVNAAGRFDLGNLNLVSWKQDVLPEHEKRTIDGDEQEAERRPFRLGGSNFNPISAVLHDPSKPPNPLRSSRKPIPAPPASSAPIIPKPPPPGFYQPFLDSLAKPGESSSSGKSVWDDYMQAITVESTDREDDEQMEGKSEGQGLFQLALPPSHKSLGKRKQDKTNDSTQEELPNLKQVPDMFFDESYTLSSEPTWRKILQENADHPDRLSAYLDIVESHLVHEIGLRAPSFFSALSNLETLASQSSSCLSEITELQNEFNLLDRSTAIRGLEVIAHHNQLKKKRELKGALEDIQNIMGVIKLSSELAEMEDWMGTLEGMEEVARWWGRHQAAKAEWTESKKVEKNDTGKRPDGRALDSVLEEEEEEVQGEQTEEEEEDAPLALASIPALSVIPDQLRYLANSVVNHLQQALSITFTSYLESPQTTAANGSTQQFSPDVKRMLLALRRCDALDKGREIWKTVVLRVIREAMRQHLSFDDEAQGKGIGLADALRSMGHERFLEVSQTVYASMLDKLQRVKPLNLELDKIISELQSERTLLQDLDASSAEPAPANGENPPTASEIFTEACDLANSRAAKVLVARTPQHAQLTLEQFFAIFTQSWKFVTDCEALGDCTMASLRGVLSSQAKAFVASYHQTRLQAAAKLVEEEQWTQVDVPTNTQHQVDLIVSSAMEDPREMKVGSGADVANGSRSGGPAKFLTIEEQTFFLVQATVGTLNMLGDYGKLIVNLDIVATDVMSRSIEFLKSFNSRTCQVVLGAGAMRSAGLKNITAKHLALASQSLSVIITVIPYIREFIRRHLNTKQAVMLVEFDKLKRDYQEHQYEIHAKLIAIMADRLSVHCASLRAINWGSSPSRNGPNPYAEQLVKETATLHKVLSKYLAKNTVETVMGSVVDSIGNKMADEFGKPELKSEDERNRMLFDAKYLKNNLVSLMGKDLAAPVMNLEAIVEAKPVPRKANQVGSAINGMFRRNNATAPNGKAAETNAETVALPPTPPVKEKEESDVILEQATDKKDDEKPDVLNTLIATSEAELNAGPDRVESSIEAAPLEALEISQSEDVPIQDIQPANSSSSSDEVVAAEIAAPNTELNPPFKHFEQPMGSKSIAEAAPDVSSAVDEFTKPLEQDAVQGDARPLEIEENTAAKGEYGS